MICVVARLYITSERRGSNQVVFLIVVTSKDVLVHSEKRLAEIKRSLSLGVGCQSKEGFFVEMLSLECVVLMSRWLWPVMGRWTILRSNGIGHITVDGRCMLRY